MAITEKRDDRRVAKYYKMDDLTFSSSSLLNYSPDGTFQTSTLYLSFFIKPPKMKETSRRPRDEMCENDKSNAHGARGEEEVKKKEKSNLHMKRMEGLALWRLLRALNDEENE